MATLIRKEVYKRGFFGKAFKFLFITFNVLMALWVFSYWYNGSQMIAAQGTDIARGAGVVGMSIGTGFLGIIWLVGAGILGLLTMATRGQKYLIEETVEDNRA